MPKRFTPHPVLTDEGRPQPWRVNIPASVSSDGKRQRHFFTTKAEAVGFCQREQIRLKNFGLSVPFQSPVETAEAFWKIIPKARWGGPA